MADHGQPEDADCRCICGGSGWRRSVLAAVLAAGYSLALTYGTAEQAVFLQSVFQSLSGARCVVPIQPDAAGSQSETTGPDRR
jgi:hypothetical protein